MASEPPARSESGRAENQLSRALSHRQIQLMAIGGAIGVGLFLGSGKAIREAGPAVLLCYLLAGAVVFLMLRALGEMAVDRPISGSFARYAEDLVGPWAGFATGWTYWVLWVTTVMAEVTAVGIYVDYFFADVPQWLPAFVSIIVLLTANRISVRWFGETEFWFALIKVTAIVAFIASGIAILVFNLGDLGEQAAVSNLWDHGGFFPKGVGGMLEALQIVTFAFIGVELIGLTAAETKNPDRELPAAINRVAWRILLFYVGAILIILMLIPWNQVSLTTSPFVIAWESIGIAAAAGILNGVVLTSALSSSNSGIFASARMMFSLAESREAPNGLKKLSRSHVPARALYVTGAALMVGVLLNVIDPEHAFVYITSVATVGILWVWGMVAVAHLCFRRAGHTASESKFASPGYPWSNYVVIGYCLLVFVLLAITPDQRIAVIAGVIWAALVALGWWRVSRSRHHEERRERP
jgi:AAT family amino acid transporter/D-serine/D-alanine/glycine transporter